MKKLLGLALVVAATASSMGCSSCGRTMRSWWNRGDSCRTCASGDVSQEYAGGLGSPVYNNVPNAPRGSNISPLPGPIEVTPIQ